jgi:hypothetical protein
MKTPQHKAGAVRKYSSHLNPTASADKFKPVHDHATEALYRVILAGLTARLAQFRGR